MKYYLLFFILGMIAYLYIPKDAVPSETANIVPIEKAVYYDEAGQPCVIYAFNPATRADCGGGK